MLTGATAANAWSLRMNPNIFPASPPCVFAETDSDGLLDWRALGKGVSWQRREVWVFLWALGWQDAHCTSSEWPQHKQSTSVDWPRGTWETREEEHCFFFSIDAVKRWKNKQQKNHFIQCSLLKCLSNMYRDFYSIFSSSFQGGRLPVVLCYLN